MKYFISCLSLLLMLGLIVNCPDFNYARGKSKKYYNKYKNRNKNYSKRKYYKKSKYRKKKYSKRKHYRKSRQTIKRSKSNKVTTKINKNYPRKLISKDEREIRKLLKQYNSKKISKTPKKETKKTTNIKKVAEKKIDKKENKKSAINNERNSKTIFNKSLINPSIAKKNNKIRLNKTKTKLIISSDSPNQGDSISLYVKSNEPILRCFGNVGGRKINFINIENNSLFRSYVGFDIQHPIGPIKIIIGVLYKNNKLAFIEKEVEVKKKVVTPYVMVTRIKYVSVKRKYRHYYTIRWKGKKIRRWKWRVKLVKVRRKYRVAVRPPSAPINSGQPNSNEIKTKMKNEAISIVNNSPKYGIGQPDEDEVDESNLGERALTSYQFQQVTPIQFWSGPFIQPTYPQKNGRISSKFGAYRIFAYRGTIRKGYHRGLDIAKPNGTPLHAPNHGIVVISDRFRARGNTVIIDHGGGIYSVHIHMLERTVEEGMFVRKGQVIGSVGSTGISTGPHLHWEIRVNGTSVNTVQWRNNNFNK